MTVVTRFAPSPTGFLHIGGARTALFNWLYARHHGGQFRLRIEDTDRARSTEEAVRAIFDGLSWLELDWDGEVVHQFEGAERHAAMAHALLGAGNAYHCYCSQEELAEMRATARAEGRPMRYDGRWRDRDPSDAPPDVKPVVRFKAPQTGETVIDDQVQGEVRFANEQLDDMVLLRADGTPTYMLSVVVDDHDMGVTHVIRGDDHLTNAARQSQLFYALDWTPPIFAHIPLIHGADGAKLSKRHGAIAVGAYAELGILPEAMRNYLLRLGWSHGDDEFITTEQAIAWFDLDAVGRSPARFDMDKLINLNGQYIREVTDDRLVALLLPVIRDRLGKAPDESAKQRLVKAMPGLRPRAKSLVDMADNAMFLFSIRPVSLDEKAARQLTPEARAMLVNLKEALEDLRDWREDALEQSVRTFADQYGLKLGSVAQPLRASLTGKTISPGIFDVMTVLGREETLGRIDDAAADK